MSGDEDYLNQLPSQLDAQFDVTSRFYSHKGIQTYKCRDLLEIRRRQAGACIEADAVFIMMNPGSSHPLGAEAEVELPYARLVLTKPDTTQYQLMRLMLAMGWERVKVLNLSDLRVTRSADFLKRVQEFKARESHDGHSRFAKSRRHELAPALSRRSGAPIVAALGVDKALQELAVAAQKVGEHASPRTPSRERAVGVSSSIATNRQQAKSVAPRCSIDASRRRKHVAADTAGAPLLPLLGGSLHAGSLSALGPVAVVHQQFSIN